MAAKPIPDGYHSVTPYMIIDGAAEALEFYKKALNAEEVMRLPGAENKVMHAEIQIGDSRIMLADEFPEMGALSPKTIGGSATHLCIYAEGVDALVEQAVAAGAELVRPVQDQFYGDRSGTVRDPFGHQWTIATHIEDLTPEEIMQRMQEQFGG